MFVNVTSSRGFGAVRRPRPRVLNLLPRRRGMSGLGWLSYPYYTPTQVMVSVPQPGFPAPTPMPTAETEMQNAAAQYVNDYNQFLQAYNTPEYTNPAAFTSNMIAYARTLCMHSWSVYTCAGFDPVSAGTKYANLVFSKLQQIAVNPNDPASISVYAKWLASPPSVTPDYTPPAPVTQPFTPSALPPAIVATLPPAVVNYVPPSPAPVSGAPAPASSPVPLPAVQTWFPPIAGGSTAGAAAPSFNLGFLTNKISIFGYGVPMWALLAGGVGVVVVAQSAGGRR